MHNYSKTNLDSIFAPISKFCLQTGLFKKIKIFKSTETMLQQSEREQIIALLHKEVKPAIGCTEPVAVALAVAKAAELLSSKPENIKVFLSANMLKNAMGVGIPGTGMVGLPIAIAMGAIIGKSEYGLEVLKDITPESIEAGKEMISKKSYYCSVER